MEQRSRQGDEKVFTDVILIPQSRRGIWLLTIRGEASSGESCKLLKINRIVDICAEKRT